MPNYSTLDKLVHSVALSNQLAKKASFDIERSLGGGNVEQVVREEHVFIAGLARAGTSILLRILHGSGCFATQTYRDMPFVLAPQLWRRISGGHRIQGEESERAHKDGLSVSFDSVEAFEEVFWLTFAGKLYVRDNYLTVHDVNDDLCAEFRDYVAIVIASQGNCAQSRYLSKNNNNILRLAGLAKALPACHIVVPFREPYQQASSLLRQHLQFKQSQSADPFERKYMSWLGHFEFGLDYRPFSFNGLPPQMTEPDSNKVDHWLERWTTVYHHLLATAPSNVLFWNYDAFCTNPQETLSHLAKHLDLEDRLAPSAAERILPPKGHDLGEESDASILRSARETHDELKERARLSLLPTAS